jgi:hypothetical protein
LSVLINSQNKLQYEGWVLVKINGFGRVYYESNIIENFASVFSLSRRSKIITLIYTDALPTIEQINSGDVKDNDVSVLTNLDWEGHLADNNTNKLVKINSQTLQSKLVSIKESKKLICLYVGGIRNGKESSYLNILKIKIPDEDLSSIVENYQNEAVIKNKCKLGGAEHVLKKVDR